MSLAVVAATSALGTVSHWRSGRVNSRLAAVFGGVALFGTMMGVRLALIVPGPIQLVIFGVVMLAAAMFMFNGPPASREAANQVGRPAVSTLLKAAPGGFLVGVLTGLVGVGGGFLIVPALIVLRTSMREAVGTSLLIITGTSIAGFLGSLGHVSLDWQAVAFVAAGTLPG